MFCIAWLLVYGDGVVYKCLNALFLQVLGKLFSPVAENREYTTIELRKMGFIVLDSAANFVMAAHPAVTGGQLYQALKERGILVRYFNTERLAPYVRITIGSKEQMDAFLTGVKEILEAAK